MTRILFVGDIMGRVGRRAAEAWIQDHVEDGGFDLIVANGENSAGGFGITERICGELFSMGIDIITGGNHSFDKKEILPYLNEEPRLLRPANYPPGVPGRGIWTGEISGGIRMAVANLQGRVFMKGVDDPFRAADLLLENIREDVDLVVIDFHAEATSEKVAFGWHMDGKVAAVVGTHTHVQTADEYILPGGTAYITDVGMTGPLDSVIGVRKEDALARFKLGIANRFQIAKGNPVFCATVLELDESSGRATGIKRIRDKIDLDNNRKDMEEE